MIVYGYVKDTMYADTGEFYVQVRIPNIHGPMTEKDYQGNKVKNYTRDENLPWYPSLLMPHTPNSGEVVALTAINEANNDWIVLGLTGGQYSALPMS